MKETGHISKSQYPGTKKNSICSKCGKSLNNKTRLQQDQHLEDHILQDIENSKQEKLF
jgi:hypothetical protein